MMQQAIKIAVARIWSLNTSPQSRKLLPLLLGGCSASDGLFIDCHIFDDNVDQAAETAIAVGEEFTVKNTQGIWTYRLAVTVEAAAE